jgi:hypothetical protein
MKESKVDGEAVILFDCPKCGGTVHQVRVVISAEAYHERDPVAGEHSDKKVKVWQASGHFPDAFTLVPSVNIVKKDGAGNWITDCWHGFITNGEVT